MAYQYQAFPTCVYSKNSSGQVEDVIVKTPEDLEELVAKTGRKWFGSPGEADKPKSVPPTPKPLARE